MVGEKATVEMAKHEMRGIDVRSLYRMKTVYFN